MLTPGLSSNQAPGSKHKCTFQARACTLELPPEEVLLPSDNFTITLHRCVSGKEQVSLVDPQFLPRRHGEQGCLPRARLAAWRVGAGPSACGPCGPESLPRETWGWEQVTLGGDGHG